MTINLYGIRPNEHYTGNTLAMETNYSTMSMLDIIFEHRNKSYGAYQLRKTYNKSLVQALLITGGIIIAMFLCGFVSQKINFRNGQTAGPAITDTIDLGNYHIKPPVVNPPVKQPHILPPPTPPAPTIRNVEYQVKANPMREDSLPSIERLRDIESGSTTTTVVTTTTVSIEPPQEPQPKLPPPIVTIAEIMPEFPGGDKALMKFLRNETQYPPYAKEAGISGKAIVQFVVNEDGSVTEAKILRSDLSEFSKEAVRVVNRLPKFKPGSQQGNPVRVRMVLPFKWELGE